MPLLLCWWGLNFGYYGLSTWISVVISKLQLGNAYLITLMYQAASAPANALSVYLVCQPTFALRGRKCVLVLGMGFSAACAFGLGALSSEDEETRQPAAGQWKWVAGGDGRHRAPHRVPRRHQADPVAPVAPKAHFRSGRHFAQP